MDENKIKMTQSLIIKTIKNICNLEKYVVGKGNLIYVKFENLNINKEVCGLANCDPFRRIINFNNYFFTLLKKNIAIEKDFVNIGCILWDTILHEITHLNKRLFRLSIANEQEYIDDVATENHPQGFHSYLNNLHKKYDNNVIEFIDTLNKIWGGQNGN